MIDELYIIVDNSGKMSEICKDSAVEYLLYTLNGLLGYGESPKPVYFSWNNDVRLLESFDELDFFGKTDTAPLEELVEQLPEGSSIMLISDGNFSASTVKKIIQKRKLRVASVAVGADASINTMKSLCTANMPFKGWEITAALRYLCGSTDSA